MLPSPRPYVRADGAVAPDHWLDPSAVWEVKCADLSLSPIYPAARGMVSGWRTGVDPPGKARWESGAQSREASQSACLLLPAND